MPRRREGLRIAGYANPTRKKHERKGSSRAHVVEQKTMDDFNIDSRQWRHFFLTLIFNASEHSFFSRDQINMLSDFDNKELVADMYDEYLRTQSTNMRSFVERMTKALKDSPQYEFQSGLNITFFRIQQFKRALLPLLPNNSEMHKYLKSISFKEIMNSVSNKSVETNQSYLGSDKLNTSLAKIVHFLEKIPSLLEKPVNLGDGMNKKIVSDLNNSMVVLSLILRKMERDRNVEKFQITLQELVAIFDQLEKLQEFLQDANFSASKQLTESFFGNMMQVFSKTHPEEVS